MTGRITAPIPAATSELTPVEWKRIGGPIVGPAAEHAAALLTECQLGDVHPSVALYIAGNMLEYVQRTPNAVHDTYKRGQKYTYPRTDSPGNYVVATITSVAKDQTWANITRVTGGKSKSGRMPLPLPHTWVRDKDLETL